MVDGLWSFLWIGSFFVAQYFDGRRVVSVSIENSSAGGMTAVVTEDGACFTWGSAVGPLGTVSDCPHPPARPSARPPARPPALSRSDLVGR